MNDIIKVFYAIILVTLTGCWNSAKILEFKNEEIDNFTYNTSPFLLKKSLIKGTVLIPFISYRDGDCYDGIYELMILAYSNKQKKEILIKRVTINELGIKKECNSLIYINTRTKKDNLFSGYISITNEIDGRESYNLSKNGVPLSVTVTAECEGESITFTYDFKVTIKRFAVPNV